jgi:hypothetical protein
MHPLVFLLTRVKASSWERRQAKVHNLSHSLIAELEKIQSTTASLPAQIQTTFKPFTDKIGLTLTDMRAVLTSQEEDVGVSEKASRVGAIIKER